MVSGGKKKILIVDDERMLLSIAATYFEQSGYEVKGLLNSDGIVQIVQEWKPDVILLDVLMPNVNGFEVLKSLKSDPVSALVPVYIFSNLDSETEIAQALELGAVGYLTKANYSLEDIQKKIEELFLRK